MTRQDLEDARKIYYQLKIMRERVERIESVVHGGAIQYDKEKVQTSVKNQYETLLAILADLTNEMEAKEAELLKLKDEIREWAGTLPKFEKAIIILRHCQFQSWNEISEQLGYSSRQIRRIHEEILWQLERIV